MKPGGSLQHSQVPQPVPILSQRNPVHSPTSHFWRYILILSSHLHLGLLIVFFPPGFPTITPCTSLLSPIRATYPAHLILLDVITRTILGEEYRSLSSSLCNFLHYPVNSSLLVPNIPLNTLLSNTVIFVNNIVKRAHAIFLLLTNVTTSQ